MPIRKRDSADAGDSCGDEQLVSGGIADPLGKQKSAGGDEPDCAMAPLQENLRKTGGGARLERATSEIITALHEAKQELAKEMEANLKQLKAVLKETQRIAKDMEAVLKEAKAEPNPEEQARGDGGQGGQKKQAKAQQDEDEDEDDDEDQGQGQGQKRSAQGDEGWNPPSFKQQRRQPRGAWEPPSFDQEQPSAH